MMINLCYYQVKNRCDLNSWHAGKEGCLQTLLHRAVDENKQKHACYLISKLVKNASVSKQTYIAIRARSACNLELSAH